MKMKFTRYPSLTAPPPTDYLDPKNFLLPFNNGDTKVKKAKQVKKEQSHPKLREALKIAGSKMMAKDFPKAFKLVVWELMKTQSKVDDTSKAIKAMDEYHNHMFDLHSKDNMFHSGMNKQLIAHLEKQESDINLLGNALVCMIGELTKLQKEIAHFLNARK